jgi:plastocyanin
LRTLALILAALAVAALAAAPAGAGKPKSKTVKVGDYFFGPSKLTVSEGTKVVWKWPTVPGDTHDVKLDKGPKGLDKKFKSKFESDLVASDYSFARTLKVPGRYTIICTLHEDDMRQTITVQRARK